MTIGTYFYMGLYLSCFAFLVAAILWVLPSATSAVIGWLLGPSILQMAVLGGLAGGFCGAWLALFK